MVYSAGYSTASAEEVAARHGPLKQGGKVDGSPVFRIPCPAHNGTERNLALWDGDDGGLGALCHSKGCSYQDILDALGVEYTYEGRRYERADGSSVERRRGPGKDMRGNHGSPEGVKVKLGGSDEPGKAVVLCEGPKAADGLECFGLDDYTAAHWDGGAGGADKFDPSPLKGRHVILWPDADQEGLKLMDKAAAVVEPVVETARLVDVSTLIDGQDAADVDREKATRMLRDATPYQFKGGLLRRLLRKEHYPNRVGFAELLMEEHAERLLCASYRTPKGDIEADPYFLRNTGLWEKNSPMLRSHFNDVCQQLKADTWTLPLKGQITDAMKRPGACAKIDSAVNGAVAVFGRIADVLKSWERDRPDDYKRIVDVKEQDLDKDGRYLGCENGVVDLKTGELLDPADARHHLVSRSTGVEFHEEATHDAVDGLTSHLSPELKEFLWACLGRAMWGEPDKMFVVLVGPGDSGKSTLFAAIKKALGDECAEFSQDLLRPARGDKGKVGPTPERVPLVRCRIIYALEAEAFPIDAVKTKHFAGGVQDTIVVQEKFRAEETRRLRATMFISGNDYPVLALDSKELANRLRCIPYPRPDTIDPKIALGVMTRAGAEAMLARLVKAAAANPPGRDLAMPETVERETEQRVQEARGPFGDWLRGNLVKEQGARVSGEEIWEAWAATVGVDPKADTVDGVARKDRAKHVRAALGVDPVQLRVDGRNQRGYEGLKLRLPAHFLPTDHPMWAWVDRMKQADRSHLHPAHPPGECEVCDQARKQLSRLAAPPPEQQTLDVGAAPPPGEGRVDS